MSTTDSTGTDVPDEIVERLEAALNGRDPAEVGAAVAHLVLDDGAAYSDAFEAFLRARLASWDREERAAAAAAFQAIPLARRNGEGHGRVAAESIKAVIAALVVETELSVRFELLSALAAQDYRDAELQPLADLVGDIASRAVEGPGDLDAETEKALRFLHDRLRAAGDVDPDQVLRREASPRIIGYAATGIPFVLRDAERPEVVLIYNRSFEAWLPPGGHFNPGMHEVPSETLIRKIKTEAGADSIVHWAPGLDFESGTPDVQLDAAPSFVLLEDLRNHPRRNPAEVHTHHYDLNYICRIINEGDEWIRAGENPAIRVPLDGVALAVDQRGYVERRIRETANAKFPNLARADVFPDVVERVFLSLAVLAGEWEEKLYAFELNGSTNGDGQPHIQLVDPPVAGLFAANGNGH